MALAPDRAPIARLEVAGYLKVEPRKRLGPYRQQSNRYVAAYKGVTSDTLSKGATGDTSKGVVGDTGNRKRNREPAALAGRRLIEEDCELCGKRPSQLVDGRVLCEGCR